MKNNNLKICLVLLLSFTIHSIKAQSFQKKPDANADQKRKYLETMLLKAKEQQVQQQAEKRNDFNIPAPNNSNNPVQTDINPASVQQKNNIQPATEPNDKKPATQQKVKSIIPGKKE